MHPTFHEGRRRSRASTHRTLYTHRSDVLYVGAAEYGHRPPSAAVAVTSTGQVKISAMLFATSPEQAEEAATALALTRTRDSAETSWPIPQPEDTPTGRDGPSFEITGLVQRATEWWEAALRSSDPTTQFQVVRRASEVAEAHGFPATRCG
ncbi:hypothetical protein HPB47_012182 [Ixodes persulcatus]|uniref:Uncharacterized protein n=1 Tax=Ixodes persulcatus TaxID=34615 RepID=A0AC60NUB0_IXOPE|nr:hypothetical protein HPB47_012182 [Ixodes persulcatus]